MTVPVYWADPDSVLDYGRDWTEELDGDTIDTSSWALDPDNVDAALVIENDDHDASTTIVWLSGGTVGVEYTVTNHITTAGGRTEDASIIVVIEQK